MKNLKTYDSFVNEGIVAYMNPKKVEAAKQFAEQYPKLVEWMKSFCKTSDAMKDYKKFIREKNKLDDAANAGNKEAFDKLVDYGFKPDKVSSSNFGTKTFFKITFPEGVLFAEVFQYLHG